MIGDVTVIDSTPGGSAAVASECGPATDTIPTAQSAWLHHAIRLRAKALGLAQNCIERDETTWRPENDIDPTARIERKPTLTADYLAENEKMADLMRDMAHQGLLAARR